MVTRLGKVLRAIRAERRELLRDMAGKLDMSPSMLSSIENGKRNIPTDFANDLQKAYGLDEDVLEQVRLAIAQTQEKVTVSLQDLSEDDQELAFSFARKFSNLDEAAKRDIQSILNREGDD